MHSFFAANAIDAFLFVRAGYAIFYPAILTVSTLSSDLVFVRACNSRSGQVAYCQWAVLWNVYLHLYVANRQSYQMKLEHHINKFVAILEYFWMSRPPHVSLLSVCQDEVLSTAVYWVIRLSHTSTVLRCTADTRYCCCVVACLQFCSWHWHMSLGFPLGDHFYLFSQFHSWRLDVVLSAIFWFVLVNKLHNRKRYWKVCRIVHHGKCLLLIVLLDRTDELLAVLSVRLLVVHFIQLSLRRGVVSLVSRQCPSALGKRKLLVHFLYRDQSCFYQVLCCGFLLQLHASARFFLLLLMVSLSLIYFFHMDLFRLQIDQWMQ